MSRSIDQDPSTNPNSDGRYNDGNAHPERVSSQHGFNSTPVHPGYKPDRLDTISPDTIKRRAPWIVGTAAVASVITGIGVFFATKGSDAHDNSISHTGGNVVATAPVVPGEANVTVTDAEMDAMSAEEFQSLDTEARLAYYGPKINEWRTASWGPFQTWLSASQKEYMSNNFPQDKSAYSNQQILNEYATDIFDASDQNDGNTEKNVQEGRKMLSVIVSPDNIDYPVLSTQIGNGHGVIVTARQASSASQDLPTITDRNFATSRVGHGRLIKTINQQTGGTEYDLFDLITASSGTSLWQFVQAYGVNDNALQADIQQLTQQGH